MRRARDCSAGAAPVCAHYQHNIAVEVLSLNFRKPIEHVIIGNDSAFFKARS